jgi:hypothetical protein
VRKAAGNIVRRRVPGAGLSRRGTIGGAARLWLLSASFLGLLLALSGEAWAAVGHGFVGSISEGAAGTGLVEPDVVAVDRAGGRVLVGDPAAGYVYVFSFSGQYEARLGGGFVDPAGVAVDEGSGDVYVAESQQDVVLVYEPDGEGGYRLLDRWSGAGVPGREFGKVTGVAVDQSGGVSAGDVYVADALAVGGGGGAVDVFRPGPNPSEGEGREGEYLRRLSGARLERANGIAVSPSNGRVMVANSFRGAVYAYSAEGAYEGKLNGKGSPYGSFAKEAVAGDVAGVAVDGASGDVFVAEPRRSAVSQYAYDSGSGEWRWSGWITSTPSGDLGEPRGVALTSSGEVFVADAQAAVLDQFGAGVIVPSVETAKVAKAALTRTRALLPGVINGEGEAASYSFQYGETAGLGMETATRSAGTGVETVSAVVEALHAERNYFYRIVGENKDGSNHGAIGEFQTSPAVTELVTGPITNTEPEGATLTGSLKREGLVTHYYFQYGTSEAYERQSPEPPGEVPAASEEKEEKQETQVKTSVTGLFVNTLYHYRVVAENAYGTTYGQDRTFTTSGPPRVSYEPTSGISQTEATIHAKINPDQIDTTYRFQYGETPAYGSEQPVGGEDIGPGSAPVKVAATLVGLKVGGTYHFRVIAENAAGITTGQEQTFTTVPSAPVDASYVTTVGATEATLHALVNPLGNDTTYQFQYGTQSCQEDPGACTVIPAAPEDIGNGSLDVAREATLTGLAPATTYHYRVIDSNVLGATEGTERLFTTQAEERPGTAALPDGRAWEMVTPPDKGGAPVEALTREGGLILASEQGNALTYVVNGALGEEVQGNRSPEWQQMLATRSVNGWSSQDIATASTRAKGIAPGNPPEYQFFTPDLSTGLVEPPEAGSKAEPPLAPSVVQATPYLRDDATGTYLPLVTEANTPPETKFGGRIHFLSATPDLSHVLLASEVALTGPRSSHGLYEWAAGQLRFVSVLPNGKPAATAELGFYSAVLARAISNDGSRIIWTNKEDTATRTGHLYLRDTVSGETIQLDAAQGVSEPESGFAEFQTASTDGSKIFFTDKQRLTPDATSEPGQLAGKPDLYECQIVENAGKLSCDLKDLTVDHNEGEHADVQGFVFGTNEDGTNVYLVAQGVLATDENGNHETAVNGRDNLYELRYEGTQWTTMFIATLSKEDGPEWEGNQNGNTAFLTARVSPNGRYLAFMSAAPITGYDNIAADAAAQGARAEEVYLYDSATPSLRCVSCDPSGARPAGVLDNEKGEEGIGLLVDRRVVWGKEGDEHWLAGNIPGWTAQDLISALFQSRYLSDEGRLYFNSPDSLVPAAKNHKEDVYQYEPSGVGSCRSGSGGCVSLISGGTSDRESAFLEATPDGSDVFFLTDAQLLPAQDTDTAFDIYDARECTIASPCLTPPAAREAPCAETEICRPAPPAQQIAGGPSGTAKFSGAGNVAPSPPPAKHAVEARKAARPLTRAQKLARALMRCRKRHPHSRKKLRACQHSAMERYGKRHTKRKETAGRKGRSGVSNARAGRRTL